MKARKVTGLDPAGTLADNAERIVSVRLDELCEFWPETADPEAVVALHDMRIAAKRLRYALEVTGHCFGPYAAEALRTVKQLQELLGDIHDCDVQIPQITDALAARLERDAAAIAAGAAGAGLADVGPEQLAAAPHRDTYAGLTALLVALQARRTHLFSLFLATWREHERRGFRARLAYALQERP